MTRPKLKQDDQILAAAARLACTQGYQSVTREAVAAEAGVSPAVVSHRFGTMIAFRRSLMRYAVRKYVLPVIAQGLAVRDPHARKAPAEVQQLAKMSI
jgi:AcrR family transcriptional regulator